MGSSHARTDDERAALARAWLAERDRFGTTQEEFARSHGIGVRTLRGYVAKYAPKVPPVRQFREILIEALNAIQMLAMRMDELDAAAAAGEASTWCRDSVPDAAASERSAASIERNTTPAAPMGSASRATVTTSAAGGMPANEKGTTIGQKPAPRTFWE